MFFTSANYSSFWFFAASQFPLVAIANCSSSYSCLTVNLPQSSLFASVCTFCPQKAKVLLSLSGMDFLSTLSQDLLVGDSWSQMLVYISHPSQGTLFSSLKLMYCVNFHLHLNYLNVFITSAKTFQLLMRKIHYGSIKEFNFLR